MERDINRIKVVLVEKKENKQVVSQSIRGHPFNSIKVVYLCLPPDDGYI